MATTSKQTILALASVGIDIGKDVFHIVGFDPDGKIVLRRKIKRLALVSEFKKLPSCIIGMEACLSAHFVSRTLRNLGHEPRITNGSPEWTTECPELREEQTSISDDWTSESAE